MSEGTGAARALALGQGVWWAATGAWPLAHTSSFEAVTGPKRARWLVRTAELSAFRWLRPRRAGGEGER